VHRRDRPLCSDTGLVDARPRHFEPVPRLPAACTRQGIDDAFEPANKVVADHVARDFDPARGLKQRACIRRIRPVARRHGFGDPQAQELRDQQPAARDRLPQHDAPVIYTRWRREVLEQQRSAAHREHVEARNAALREPGAATTQILAPDRERRVTEVAAAVAGAVEIDQQHLDPRALQRARREREHPSRLVELLGEWRQHQHRAAGAGRSKVQREQRTGGAGEDVRIGPVKWLTPADLRRASDCELRFDKVREAAESREGLCRHVVVRHDDAELLLDGCEHVHHRHRIELREIAEQRC
jgi:hypothetical protein